MTNSLDLGGRQHTRRAVPPPWSIPPQPGLGYRTQLSARCWLTPSCAPAAWADVPQGCPGAGRWYKHCTPISELSSCMHSVYRSLIKSRVPMCRPLNKETLPIMHTLTGASPRSRCHFFLSYFQRMHVISFNLYRAIKVPDQMHKHSSNCIMKIPALKTAC